MSIYQITEVSLPWGPGTFPAIGFWSHLYCRIQSLFHEMDLKSSRKWLVNPITVMQVVRHWVNLAWQFEGIACRDHKWVRLLPRIPSNPSTPVARVASFGTIWLEFPLSCNRNQKCMVSSAIWYYHLVTMAMPRACVVSGACGASWSKPHRELSYTWHWDFCLITRVFRETHSWFPPAAYVHSNSFFSKIIYLD